MLSIVYPETLGQMIQGWVNAYKEGGWLPKVCRRQTKAGVGGTEHS